MKSTNQDMADSMFFWGIARTYQYGVGVAAVSWNSVTKKCRKKINKRTTVLADKIRRNTGCPPSIKTKAFFYMMRLAQKHGWNAADQVYWKENGWLGKKRPWRA